MYVTSEDGEEEGETSVGYVLLLMSLEVKHAGSQSVTGSPCFQLLK